MTVPGLFDRVRNIKPGVPRRVVCIAVVALAAPFFMFGIGGMRINASPSLPLGIYMETTDRSAPLIEFCPLEPYGSFAAGRGYRSRGNCPDGADPLMKPVIANAGDIVDFSSRGIAVNGVLLPNTAPKAKDTQGRPMKPWPCGHYRVEDGSVWVASSYNSSSFDSRYFGPIPVAIIRGRLKPFLTL
jgi:conjugative transfer signal peptidase TraF